jgi:hypothetical protein
MPDDHTRSFWLGRRQYDPQPALDGALRADIVIVGGGFTGLSRIRQSTASTPSPVCASKRGLPWGPCTPIAA